MSDPRILLQLIAAESNVTVREVLHWLAENRPDEVALAFVALSERGQQ